MLLAHVRDIYFQAVWALRDNLMRTLLSILGIFIGIIAVMAVGTVTQTVHNFVFTELASYGLQTIWIYRQHEAPNPYSTVRTGSGITNLDLEQIQKGCCPAVARVSPEVYYQDWSQLFRFGNRYNNVILEGVDGVFFDISRDEFTIGRNFRDEDIDNRRNVAIIGSEVHKTLIGEHQNPVGKSIRFGEQKFIVVGVLKRKNRDFLASIGAAEDYDVNNKIYIPYTVHQQMLASKDIHQLLIESRSVAETQNAVDQVVELLQRRNNNHFQYKWDTMESWNTKANNILSNISLLGLVAAFVSLLVGGVGIMNIMTTSVVERTREIGIRKAIGATQNDIRLQFILEAVVISTLGGSFGLGVGYILSIVAQHMLQIPLQPPWMIIIAAFLVSIGVGLASGYYPAKRAARLKPVEALRHD